MRWLTGATTALEASDPAIKLSHCRGPMVSICRTTTSNPPVWPLPIANRTRPSKSRNPKSTLHFMTAIPSLGSTTSGQREMDTSLAL